MNNNSSNDALVQKSLPLFSLWNEKDKISLFEYKMLDKYLSKINSHDPNSRVVTFTIEDITDITSAHLTKSELHNRLKKLQSLVVSYGEDRAITLFEYSEIHIDEKKFEVKLMCTQSAHKFFFNIERVRYFKYKFRNVLAISSMHSYILFNFLEMNRFRKQPFEVELSELKNILGCETSTYDEFKYFNRQVLKKCYKEITEKTELQYSYEPIKVNRTIERIKFDVFPLKQLEGILSDYSEDENMIAVNISEFKTIDVTSDELEKDNFNLYDFYPDESEEESESEQEKSSENVTDSRINFFSECFDNSFDKLQVQYILSSVNKAMVKKSEFGQDIAMYDYLDNIYKRFLVEENERKISNRFKYFVSMIKNDGK